MPESPENRSQAAGDEAEILLDTVRRLVSEMRPRSRPTATLDSLLDRDLGLDSLALVELIARLEQALGVILPERVLTAATTPRDLLRALPTGSGRPPGAVSAPEPAAPPQALAPPAGSRTLLEVLGWYAARAPDRLHIRILEETGHEDLTYGALREGALAVARGLCDQGLEPGEAVGIMLPTSREYFLIFFGILLAGGVPVPIYPPWRDSQIEEHLLRQARVLDNAVAAMVVTVPEARNVARLLRLQVPSLRRLVEPGDIVPARSPDGWEQTHVREADIALLQYTSGSTGSPKGVVLTHANLLANIRAMGSVTSAGSTDVFVSWLPLYHDMGLIGAWFGSLYHAMPLVVMAPTLFLAQPARWLRAIHEHGGTISASPNFGFELCLRHVEDDQIGEVDLSCWRIALNGAEAVSPETIRSFAERFAGHGFRPEAMTPVYGLAEAAVGLTFPPLGRGPRIDTIARAPFLRSGMARSAPRDDPNPLRFVACGRPLPGHRIRIADAAGGEVGERQEGHILFRGPSATSGYFRNPEATGQLFHGGWLDTGDLGYEAEGELYVTGRVKDLVIRAGRNIHPEELEEAAGSIAGIRKGRIAVFGSPDPVAGTERLIVLAETRVHDEDAREELRRQIVAASVDRFGMPPDDVVLALPGTVSKTSSGKIRRAASRELYEQGRVSERARPVWRQVLGLLRAGIVSSVRRLPRGALALAYAGYAWMLVALLAPVVWLLVMVLPRHSLRWAVLRGGARLLLGLAGARLAVQGRQRLASSSYVAVANHASVLDGLVLAAALPGPLVFVAIGDLAGGARGRFLRRIGAEFVEGADRTQALADSRRLVAIAQRGSTLAFFPEGTMSRGGGLQPFRMGAFVAAAEAGAPVVTVAIRGTGAILRGDRRVPRRGRIEVVIEGPIQAREKGWAGALELRDAAREALLRHCGEPDLEA